MTHVRWNNIDKMIESMNEDQCKWTLKILAINIKNQDTLDKFDFVDGVRLGLSKIPEDSEEK